MSNVLHEKAIKAAKRYMLERDYEVLATSWQPADGEGGIDLVAQNEDTVIFVDVTATTDTNAGFSDGHSDRSEVEVLAAKYLSENTPEEDGLAIRFDVIDMIVVSADRAVLRHHINAMSKA